MTDPKKQSADSQPVEVSPQVPEGSQPVEVSPQLPPNPVDEQKEIEAALARKTKDGKGDEEVPESNFVSFATDDVERKTVEELAAEVLDGKWGTYIQPRLKQAGYDASAVQTEVNRRLAGGAPSVYRSTVKDIASQVIRGEWGDKNEYPRNLERAGYDHRQIELEVQRQLGN